MHIADAISRDKENFRILIGLDMELVEQLKTYSLDENGFLTQKEQSFFMVIQNNIK